MDQPISFTPHEIAHLAEAEFFRTKALVSEKVRRTLEQLHQVFQSELGGQELLTPEGFNPEAVQFVKGEHLEAFPYQYLDFPRYYTREEKFAFRSLFWWGHHVVFSLIVEGSSIRFYKQNLIHRYSNLADKHICLCISPSLWEWKYGAGYTLELTQDNKSEIAAVLAHRPFFKIARFVPMTDPLIQSGEIVRIGREAFRVMLSTIASSG